MKDSHKRVYLFLSVLAFLSIPFIFLNTSKVKAVAAVCQTACTNVMCPDGQGGSTCSSCIDTCSGGTPVIRVRQITPTPTNTPAPSPTLTPLPTAPPVPTSTFVPPSPTTDPCPKRLQGDANCDGQVNETDYGIFKSSIQGSSVCTNCSADFNRDGKVNVVDYEIWRNTVYN